MSDLNETYLLPPNIFTESGEIKVKNYNVYGKDCPFGSVAIISIKYILSGSAAYLLITL